MRGNPMAFVSAIRSGYRNMLNFEGRASRSEYGWFSIWFGVTVLGGFAVLNILDGAASHGGAASVAATIWGLALLVFAPVTFIAEWAMNVRRLHDTDRSGWSVLSSGATRWVFEAGSPGDNRFGPPQNRGRQAA
jgi:uncharacterized membrane protein YhaH (DUF805 family)